MDTPEFLTTSLHGITIIATPLHILGTYCILYQTPKTMDSVKWVMLNFHCWCMILDWSLTILTIPYLLYPSMGGFPLGILKDFGIGVDYQVYFVVSVICTVIASIVLIFENRFYIMFAKNTRWEKIRKLYIPGNFVFSFTFFIPALFNVPDQEIAVRQMHILIPNMPPSISNYKLFVMATEFTWVIVPITAASLVYFTAFYILLTLLSKNLKNATKLSTYSRNTLNLQKKFMHSMHIQASVFLLNIQLPVVYGLISQYTGYFNQVYNNWSFIALSLHGVASTVVLIYVHKPYREFCSQMLGTAKRRIPRRSIVSVVIVSQT
uniref:Serpentine Receptor, class H n=2 Tax=Caenorhabditis tropicalis TaxID=1561998 RepID=A0A1I7V273_9PELO